MREKTIHIFNAGKMPYAEALALQKRLLAAKKAGDQRDFLVLVEHPPVVTLGRAADEANLRLPRGTLAARGVEVYDIERGGDVTFHGPGQLVGYPIVDLKRAGLGVHGFLRLVESTLIDAAGVVGVAARRRPGLTGVWTDRGKVAAVGIAVSRWITWHGFALNVKHVSGFDLIIPCGLADEAVTSLEEVRGEDIAMPRMRETVAGAFARALARDPVVQAAPQGAMDPVR